jgi:magnesium-transporting ATPase (P-type)
MRRWMRERERERERERIGKVFSFMHCYTRQMNCHFLIIVIYIYVNTYMKYTFRLPRFKSKTINPALLLLFLLISCASVFTLSSFARGSNSSSSNSNCWLSLLYGVIIAPLLIYASLPHSYGETMLYANYSSYATPVRNRRRRTSLLQTFHFHIKLTPIPLLIY